MLTLFNWGAKSVQHLNFCNFFQNQKSYKESKKKDFTWQVHPGPLYNCILLVFLWNVYFWRMEIFNEIVENQDLNRNKGELKKGKTKISYFLIQKIL